jgi:3-oxoadipate enol-lactonase
MPFATAHDGTKLHYTVDDFTDPWKNAPYIVLQHGFGRNGRFWYKWVPYLARHYKVLRLDMRGFGQSREGFGLTRDFTLQELTDDVRAVFDHAGIETAHFCGEAFGGTLGYQFAATHPDRLRTLSVLSAPVFLHPTTHMA